MLRRKGNSQQALAFLHRQRPLLFGKQLIWHTIEHNPLHCASPVCKRCDDNVDCLAHRFLARARAVYEDVFCLRREFCELSIDDGREGKYVVPAVLNHGAQVSHQVLKCHSLGVPSQDFQRSHALRAFQGHKAHIFPSARKIPEWRAHAVHVMYSNCNLASLPAKRLMELFLQLHDRAHCAVVECDAFHHRAAKVRAHGSNRGIYSELHTRVANGI